MKERFGTFDVRAMVHNVSQEILGLRAANIYDINNKTYLIKFSKPGSSPACVGARRTCNLESVSSFYFLLFPPYV